jgi:hypothetical protein
MKKLPIGVQTFEKMIHGQYLYVDKTAHIFRLISQGGDYFFLSRPRRFGKSLLVSTLKELFQGHKELFQDLFIYDKIEWASYPVIHLDFLVIPCDTEARLTQGIRDVLGEIAAQHEIELQRRDYDTAFRELIAKLAEKHQQPVVVLVDEYDKPILDHLDNLSLAEENRKILKNFYGTLKGSDAHLEFVLLTGVSKFSQVSIFSDLNNLNDITLDAQYATLLGYTQQELEHYFDDYLHLVCQEFEVPRDALLRAIQAWYNGYSWNARDRVYNPVSILNCLSKREFANYWFSTGTPTFLIRLAKQMKIDVSELECRQVSRLLFDSFELDKMNIFALLFQSGYLTITDMQRKRLAPYYTLRYPNREVKEAFVTYLLESFTENTFDEIQITAERLREDLEAGNLDGFMQGIRAIFAKIPYTLHLEQEAYYHSLFYMVAVLLGVEIELEVLTDKGRIDGVLELPDMIYVIEFKYGKSGADLDTLTSKALKQLQEKHYAERFLTDPRQCLLLGIGFADKEIGCQLAACAPD